MPKLSYSEHINMVEKIDGQKIAERIKDDVAQEIYKLKGPRPNLAIILVGERPDSKLYVSLKEREAKKVGIDTHVYLFAETSSEDDLIATINFLNNDPEIDAILVQLPLPENFNADRIIANLDPEKDVDRFHPQNTNDTQILSPVFASILESLEDVKYKLDNRETAVIYNSLIFGQSLKNVLEKESVSVNLISSDDPALNVKTKTADIIISAIGRPHFIKADMIKADAVLIDVGITKIGNKILGDVDYESVKEKASYISPVPGGIGPITIACLFKNTLALYKRNKKPANL